MKAKPVNDQVRVRRAHKRGQYDRETMNAVLDAGLVADIGFIEQAKPVVTPMTYWRHADYVYWHGSTASRMMKATAGRDVCFTVTLLDGLVLAQSAFHHSANYRSVMLFGIAEQVRGTAAKTKALEAFFDKLFAGRWQTLRSMTGQEMKATSILRLKIDQGAAKIRTGPPIEAKGDLPGKVWSGVLDFDHSIRQAQPSADNIEGLELPEHVKRLVGKPR
ncbi:Pyridoxamine 5'-phosphate oxidase-related, FMN-binding [hydrothermal vent metagenome]|uniref:Pyridoxamine 5'-phosphate oxidase-related, FMN-binding n=1 Tax=hydrothermal vent metagenome TaxID=652676 RepID=A0A3B0RHG3_9ZZZZ